MTTLYRRSEPKPLCKMDEDTSERTRLNLRPSPVARRPPPASQFHLYPVGALSFETSVCLGIDKRGLLSSHAQSDVLSKTLGEAARHHTGCPRGVQTILLCLMCSTQYAGPVHNRLHAFYPLVETRGEHAVGWEYSYAASPLPIDSCSSSLYRRLFLSEIVM